MVPIATPAALLEWTQSKFCAGMAVAREMEHIENAGGKYLYGTMRVEDIWMDETREDLLLTLIYAEREGRLAAYGGVYYNEIMENGMTIVMAEEYPLAALETPRFRGARERFARDCGEPETGLFAELAARGIRLFVHYGKERDHIILARRAEIQAR